MVQQHIHIKRSYMDSARATTREVPRATTSSDTVAAFGYITFAIVYNASTLCIIGCHDSGQCCKSEPPNTQCWLETLHADDQRCTLKMTRFFSKHLPAVLTQQGGADEEAGHHIGVQVGGGAAVLIVSTLLHRHHAPDADAAAAVGNTVAVVVHRRRLHTAVCSGA